MILDDLLKEAVNEKEKKNSNDNNREIDIIKNSYSYKLGRAITYIPRMILETRRCIREYGMANTWKIIKQELSRRFK